MLVGGFVVLSTDGDLDRRCEILNQAGEVGLSMATLPETNSEFAP